MAETKQTQIIAEIGANHGGNMDLAVKMIEAAAAAGVDWVKFQSWRAETLPADYPPADVTYYQQHQLSDDDHVYLLHACQANNVKFLTTCFDKGRILFLAGLGLSTIKVASPDLTSHAMLKELCQHFDHLIVSTGMSYDEEIIQTADLLAGHSYTFLHCVSLYPTPLAQVNLARMEWLRQFTPSVGFSDHTLGTVAGKLAISRGAVYLEKHFTLSRDLPGRDQAVSAEPDELRELAEYAAAVTPMIGTAHPGLSPTEISLRQRYIGKWGNNRTEE